MALPPESIDVDGTTVDAASSLATLRAACDVLGRATAGNKSQLFKRLSKHVMGNELLASHQVQHSLSSEMARQPDEQNIAAMPSEEEKRKHFLTHEPFQPLVPSMCCISKTRSTCCLFRIPDVKIQWLALIGDSSTEFPTRTSSQSSLCMTDEQNVCMRFLFLEGVKAVYPSFALSWVDLSFGYAIRVSSSAATTSLL